VLVNHFWKCVFFFFKLQSTLADRPDIQCTPSSPVEGDEHKPLNTPIVIHCFAVTSQLSVEQTGLKYLICLRFSVLWVPYWTLYQRFIVTTKYYLRILTMEEYF